MFGNLSKFESKIVEYKEEVNHKNYEKWAKTVVAFANTDGGSIYFGVNDDGELIGLEPDILKKEIPYINTVCDKNISFQNLLGTLKEFYKKLGFEVRFRPAYFPYTYLSVESEIYLEEKESWIELGGSGMFRPEVLKPLGINQPALAFGLGIERLAMIRYDVEDIRMLYKSDLKWLRELLLDKGVEL